MSYKTPSLAFHTCDLQSLWALCQYLRAPRLAKTTLRFSVRPLGADVSGAVRPIWEINKMIRARLSSEFDRVRITSRIPLSTPSRIAMGLQLCTQTRHALAASWLPNSIPFVSSRIVPSPRRVTLVANPKVASRPLNPIVHNAGACARLPVSG